MKEAKTFAPKEVLRRDWMFKLVGTETFSVGKNKAACSIKIEPVGGFSYEYSLEVIELVGRLMMVSTRWLGNRTRSSSRTRTKP